MNADEVLVIDASAAIAVVVGDDGSTAVDREIRSRASAGVRLAVPELFWIETVNTLGRRHNQPFEAVRRVTIEEARR
jgi:predicted nucleic acid-binding protein